MAEDVNATQQPQVPELPETPTVPQTPQSTFVPPVQNEVQVEEELEYEEPQSNGKGKFSFIGSLICFILSLSLFGLSIYGMATPTDGELVATMGIIACVVLGLFSILTLIFGIIGCTRQPRGKAITGIVFSSVNIISFITLVILFIAVMEIATRYYSNFYYDSYYYY